MQRAAERVRELAVGDRLGRGRVDRARPALVLRARRSIMPDEVLAVDPGDVLAPPATGPPTPSRNGGSIFASAPPSRSSTTPVRTCTTRMPSSPRLGRLGLPVDARRGEEVAARRGVLVERLFAVRAVVADRRGADQRVRGAAPAVRRAAASNPAESGCGCRVTRLSRIARLARALQRWATFSPARCTTASRPASAATGAGFGEQIPAAGLDTPAPPARGHGSRESTVTSAPLLAQRGDERAADQPGCSRHGHAHGDHPFS